jgi:hypothetical protein
MIAEKLEEKLEKFLIENNRSYYKDSIKYICLRERATIDGQLRNFHLVSFRASLSDQQYDSDGFYFARFDETKHHLVEIIGPQSWENFEQ